MLCNTTGDTYEVKMNWVHLVLESCSETCAVLKCKEVSCILLIYIYIYIFIYSYFGQWQCVGLWWLAYISYASAVSTFHNMWSWYSWCCHSACSDVHTNSPMIMPVFPYVPWCTITNTGQSKIWSSLGTGCGSYLIVRCYTVWFGRQVLMFLKKLLPPYFSVYRTSHVAPAALHSTH